jgi:hypothetical protein
MMRSTALPTITRRRAAALVAAALCALSTLVQPARACALDRYGALVECGGLAPVGLYLALASGAQHHCAVTHPQRGVACWPPDAPAATSRPAWVSNVQALASGLAHSCAVWGPQKILSCWGSLRGLHGTGNASAAAVNVTRGVRMLAESSRDAEHVCFLRESNNDVSCFGNNAFQQLGLGEDGIASLVVAADALRAD